MPKLSRPINRIIERNLLRNMGMHLYAFLEWIAGYRGRSDVTDDVIVAAFVEEKGAEFAQNVLKEFGAVELDEQNLRLICQKAKIEIDREAITLFIGALRECVAPQKRVEAKRVEKEGFDRIHWEKE